MLPRASDCPHIVLFSISIHKYLHFTYVESNFHVGELTYFDFFDFIRKIDGFSGLKLLLFHEK